RSHFRPGQRAAWEVVHRPDGAASFHPAAHRVLSQPAALRCPRGVCAPLLRIPAAAVLCCLDGRGCRCPAGRRRLEFPSHGRRLVPPQPGSLRDVPVRGNGHGLRRERRDSGHQGLGSRPGRRRHPVGLSISAFCVHLVHHVMPRRSGPLPWLLLYVFGVGLAFLAGYRMTVPYDFFQFLAKEPLRSRLGESLLNLHAQPPLLNLLLGMALKLERATGWAPERTLLVLHLALGAVVTVALWTLLVRLGVSPWLRRLVMVLVLLDPAFYIFLLLFFYSFHELVLLLLAAVAVQRFLVTRQVRFYAAACACLVTLTYTRTLFHFVWTLAVLAGLALIAWRGRPHRAAPTDPDRAATQGRPYRSASIRPVLGLLAASAILLLA